MCLLYVNYHTKRQKQCSWEALIWLCLYMQGDTLFNARLSCLGFVRLLLSNGQLVKMSMTLSHLVPQERETTHKWEAPAQQVFPFFSCLIRTWKSKRVGKSAYEHACTTVEANTNGNWKGPFITLSMNESSTFSCGDQENDKIKLGIYGMGALRKEYGFSIILLFRLFVIWIVNIRKFL